MSVGIEPFDIQSFDKQIGLESSDSVVPVGDLNLPDADRNALDRVAQQPPQGVNPGQSQETTDNTPEYLKPFMAEKPADDHIDWKAELERLTGATPDGDVTSDDVFKVATEQHIYQDILSQDMEYRQAADLVNRDYSGQNGEQTKVHDYKELVQEAIKSRIEPFIEAEYDRQLAYLIDPETGELTHAGEKYAETLVGQKKALVRQREELAKTTAQQEAIDGLRRRAEFSQFIDTNFKPMGIELDEEQKRLVKDDILSGRTYQRLNNMNTEDEAMLAIFLNPYLRAKFIHAHYERGGTEGAKQRLASQLR